MSDKKFKNIKLNLGSEFKKYTKGSIIGDDKYKPDISIINSKEKVVCVIESSSTGDRKVHIGEMFQSHKFYCDEEIKGDLIISLAGSSKNSPRPDTSYKYLKPYFDFIKKESKIGLKRVHLIEQDDFIKLQNDGVKLLDEKFINKCTTLD
ncbi:hypothetical protein SAMN04515654_12311 [Halanaerobium congolense]|uniref:Uncharacterized protein n=1 Tax=Halanaerobium congolense TaxID=54121 RepID=A0A1G8Q9J6_9FIRM|nr:hypothetical protein [Halanaerobium congolense]SDJ01361.1 hypothetical protein SAMN04515654_12311 [Halanaerobium congolense]SET67567.1 hypothetical protein SAMN04515653_12435 [Halanaerobium congolense]